MPDRVTADEQARFSTCAGAAKTVVTARAADRAERVKEYFILHKIICEKSS